MEKKQNWYENKSKYHFIYKTTNIINQKYYIGMHSTNDISDGYLGSGTRLWRSIQHYGRENFKVEILEYLTDRESLRKREAEIVDLEKLKDPLCMNLTVGGYGELSRAACSKGGKLNGYHIRKLGNYGWKRQDYKQGNNFRKAVSDGLKMKWKRDGHPWSGRSHSEEARKKIGTANSVKQAGELNSQFGTRWISNEDQKISKRILKTEEVPVGWIIGRNTWILKEKHYEIKRDKLKFQSQDRLKAIEETVQLYEKLKSLRSVATKLEVSHIEVRNRIKQYEQQQQVSVLSSHGKRVILR